MISQTMASRADGSHRALSCDSGTSACSLLQASPNLAEMMLLVDTTKRHQHVRQVHLKYEEVADSADMPSLRRFIRPTDWESVRSKVKLYAEDVSTGAGEPKYLSKGLCFRMLDDPRKYMLARVAKLSARSQVDQGSRSPTGRINELWLYLTDFVVPECRAASELQGISEVQD